MEKLEGHPCVDGSHKFKPLGLPYHYGEPGRPVSVEYQRLYCKRCGISTEVVSADHRTRSRAEVTLRSEVP